MHLLVNSSQMSFTLDDNLVSKDTVTAARETLTVVLSRGGWKQSPVYTGTAPRHTNSSGGLAVLQKCQKHTPLLDDDILREVQWLGKPHRPWCQSQPANYPTVGFSAALSVQEYWKFNISKNISVLTGFFIWSSQSSFWNILFSDWQYFIKDKENPQMHFHRPFCDTELVSCSQWPLQTSGGIQISFTLIFKLISIAQVLTDLQSGS